MFRMRRPLWVAFLLLPCSLYGGTIYQLMDLGVLPGGSFTAAAGISSNGRVTGSGDTASAISAPFLWAPGQGLSLVDPVNSYFAQGAAVNALGSVAGIEYSSGDLPVYRAFVNSGSGAAYIPTLGGDDNAATGINDSGKIVGYSDTGAASQAAFSYSPGAGVTSLGTPAGASDSWAYAINNSGEIAGAGGRFDPTGSFVYTQAAVFSNGSWGDLPILGYQSSGASAISDAGQVAGTLNDGSGGTMAFLWTPAGSMVTLGELLVGAGSQAYGVNSSGFVVGTSGGFAFLYGNSTMYDLTGLLDPAFAGWQLMDAMAINDRGQIAGVGVHDNELRAFLLTPNGDGAVPEPASAPIACGGLLVLVAAFRRLRCQKNTIGRDVKS